MKIYVVRHGETNTNLEHRINGHNDGKLNETGIIQAKKLSEKLKNIDFDLIITSPLLRTKETAALLNQNNIPMIEDKRIIERDAGDWTEKPIEEVDIISWWDYSNEENWSNSENVKDMYERVVSFLEDIKIKYKDKKLLIVTHGGVMNCIYGYVNNFPKTGYFLQNSFNNCELVEFDI